MMLTKDTYLRKSYVPKYIHLYGNKWLKVKPEEVDGKYYKHEPDSKGNSFSGKKELWHQIVISDKMPQ
jgi:hypothetical protein